MSERGQTAYDYLLGALLLIVTIVAVVSIFPQVFSPFVDPVSTDEERAAERTAATVLEKNGTVDGERTLDVDEDTFDDRYVAVLRNESGVSDLRRMSVSLQDEQGIIERGGDERTTGQPTSTVARIVRLPPGSGLDRCTSGCRLVVRVW